MGICENESLEMWSADSLKQEFAKPAATDRATDTVKLVAVHDNTTNGPYFFGEGWAVPNADDGCEGEKNHALNGDAVDVADLGVCSSAAGGLSSGPAMPANGYLYR